LTTSIVKSGNESLKGADSPTGRLDYWAGGDFVEYFEVPLIDGLVDKTLNKLRVRTEFRR